MMKEAVLAILALLVVSCQMKTLLVKTKSKGGDDYNLQKNTGNVGGNMFQGRGSGNFQGNSGSVAGNMVQDYNLQKNTGSVGGSMLQGRGSGFGNNVQNNGGSVAGNMVQDYEAKVSCKTLVARMKNCKRKKGEEVPPKCVAILKRFVGQKCRFKGADGEDYQFTLGNIGNIQCNSQVCSSNSRDYANALQIGCCSHQ